MLGGAGGSQLTIGGLEAVVHSVAGCRWGVTELVGEAVFEDAVVRGARIGVESVWVGALFDLAQQQPQAVESLGDLICAAEAGVGVG